MSISPQKSLNPAHLQFDRDQGSSGQHPDEKAWRIIRARGMLVEVSRLVGMHGGERTRGILGQHMNLAELLLWEGT